LRKNVRDRFPVLKKLEVARDLGGMVMEERGANNLSPNLVGACRRKSAQVMQNLGYFT
jgi:hypothetical protein